MYPDVFENAPTRSVFESFSPVHTKTRKRYPLLSMRHATMYVNDVFWCMTSSYSKPPFLSVHTKKKSWRFQKCLPWRAFLERWVFGDRFHRIRVGGRPNRRKKISVFKQKRVGGALNTHDIRINIQQWDLESSFRQTEIGGCTSNCQFKEPEKTAGTRRRYHWFPRQMVASPNVGCSLR